MITLTQLAGSTEPMQFAVASIDDEGNVSDPSNNGTNPVAVAFALVTSPPTLFNPGTATWNTATWSVQPGSPATCWANVMPGPANGGIPVAAGSYVAYVRVTTSTAVPILPAAYVIFV